ncbi:hypothetical protein E5Q_00045 [Mixia osmundae IAM 14324]|uniref:Calcium-transporting ATPase n=1 Tax=Mixia osmundae (strain CBS 9802 / IAM 14324 / JCM 22182 / KY 12970) TaxID=764103 RepID=G7DS44_MIXOS|nr:hypothetical protein E5Q_00045 [Mixia osmundae IAM 14324]
MDRAYSQTTKQVLEHFRVDQSVGLSAAQVEANANQYGRNELPSDPPTPLIALILEQFKDQLVIILLISAVISFVLALLEEGDKATAFVEPIVILLILIANAVVGVVQESNAEQAIEALMEFSPDEAKVLRDGKPVKVHATELVPGDIISVAVGDKIPADARVLSVASASFTIDQAILTGESVSVSKTNDVVKMDSAVKQDMINMLFSGTTVVSGNAKAVVTSTGQRTAIGDIHKAITTQISEKTPLKQKVDDFGEALAKVISVVCILVWLVNIRNFGDPSHHGYLKGAIYYFKIAVALAVAAIPEGLPVVITTCLALGTKKMAKKNAIVRSLPSVETLGCTQVICADKTGTLTTNQMSVARLVVASASGLDDYSVEGSTFAPVGRVLNASGQAVTAAHNQGLARLGQIACVCNDAKISYNEDTNAHGNVGEPTEAALKTLAEKLGTTDAGFNTSIYSLAPSQRNNAVSNELDAQFSRLLTFEFSRDRKSMSVLTQERGANGKAALFVKGAPEAILERCKSVQAGLGSSAPLSASVRTELLAKIAEFSTQGLRCLALALHDDVDADASHYKTSSAADYVKFEQDLTLVGIVGMLDPPRPEVRGAIAKCRSAGIRIIVITGDNKNTAETICRQIGVFGSSENLTGKSFTGQEFDALTDKQKVTAVLEASLFSRTEPGHKSQLVELLQAQGLVVAMTGDGVNDAPALKRANIGIAMGTGQDVAKQAADMVLADSNFASIEAAVEEGRSIYENTKQFIRYLISSNIGEVVSIFLTVLLGMPEALIPVQLLWVNLVTDGLPATALGFNPADHTIMRRPPRDAKEALVGPWLFLRYMVVGTYVGIATVAGYAWWYMYYSAGPQISFYQLTHFHSCSSLFPEVGCEIFLGDSAKRATTISLSILVTIEMANALNSLSENESLLTLPPWANLYLCGAICLSMALHFMILYVPFFADLFVIVPLNWAEWKAVLAFSLPVIVIDEVFKFIGVNFIAPPSKIKTE